MPALVLAAVVGPYAAFSQSVFEPVAKDERQARIVATIRTRQTQDGPFSPDLVGPLTALGLLYYEEGDHDLAAAANERAMQVVRANFGLYAFEQAPLIRQSIHNEEARGANAAAWNLERELLNVISRHPDDLRAVPLLREVADKRMDLLRRFSAGEFPPEIFLGCFYRSDIGSCTAGSRGVAKRSILWAAQRNYLAAIGVLVRQGLFSSEELRELEMILLRSSAAHGNYGIGAQSLRRLLTYDAASAEPALSQLDSLVQIADWELLYKKYGAALDIYEQAHRQLIDLGAAQAEIDEIFSPEIPAVLPVFLPNPLVSVETPASIGYVDVAFRVTRYGRSRHVEILDTSKNATRAAKRRLARQIARMRFRPRLIDDRIATTSPIVIRYYLNE
jgi:tetratricopeptide (TPR) repeat protein